MLKLCCQAFSLYEAMCSRWARPFCLSMQLMVRTLHQAWATCMQPCFCAQAQRNVAVCLLKVLLVLQEVIGLSAYKWHKQKGPLKSRLQMQSDRFCHWLMGQMCHMSLNQKVRTCSYVVHTWYDIHKRSIFWPVVVHHIWEGSSVDVAPFRSYHRIWGAIEIHILYGLLIGRYIGKGSCTHDTCHV